MRQRRQTLQRTILIISISMLFFMMEGCKKNEEASTLLAVDVSETDTTEENAVEEKEEAPVEDIYVYVCGEVRNPGVYKLTVGSRINHAIFAAGGMTDLAADTYLNQAEILEDGQKIYVPDKEEVEEQALAAALKQAEETDDRININTADKAQLTQLSGIGDSRAEAIIVYRETVGPFESIEEIKKIDGIKDGIFEKIKEKIKVE